MERIFGVVLLLVVINVFIWATSPTYASVQRRSWDWGKKRNGRDPEPMPFMVWGPRVAGYVVSALIAWALLLR